MSPKSTEAENLIDYREMLSKKDLAMSLETAQNAAKARTNQKATGEDSRSASAETAIEEPWHPTAGAT